MTAPHPQAWLGSLVRMVLGLVALAILSDGLVSWLGVAPGTPVAEVLRRIMVGQATYWILLAILAGVLALRSSRQSAVPFVVVGVSLATAALLSVLAMPSPPTGLDTVRRQALDRLFVQNVLATVYLGGAWLGVGFLVRSAGRADQSASAGRT